MQNSTSGPWPQPLPAPPPEPQQGLPEGQEEDTEDGE